MPRPCFLVIDREHFGSSSTRQLVIGVAKLNVITACGGAEALETVERFPAVDGMVVEAGIQDVTCEDFVRQIRQRKADLPIIVIGTPLWTTMRGG